MLLFTRQWVSSFVFCALFTMIMSHFFILFLYSTVWNLICSSKPCCMDSVMYFVSKVVQWMQSKMLLFHVGSFDLKTSRVQECGSMDMSKFGHSQTGKIKSKHKFVFFDFFHLYRKSCMPYNPLNNFFLPWTQTHILKFDHLISSFCPLVTVCKTSAFFVEITSHFTDHIH